MPSLPRRWTDGAAASAAVFFALCAGTVPSLASADLWWHLRSGWYIFATHSVPRTDPFSFTFAGRPWIAHEWLSDLLIYRLYHLAGPFALLGCFSLIVAVAFWLAFRMTEASVLSCVPGLALAVAAAHPTFLVRPQAITLLLFSLFRFLLWQYRRSGKPWVLALLPSLTFLWVNLHGGYIIGIIVILFSFAGELFESLTGPPPRKLFTRSALRLLATAFACLLVVPLNPNGFRLYTYPFETLFSPAMQANISEWFPPDPHQALFFPFFLLLLCTLAALFLRRKTICASDFFLVAALAFGAVHSSRHIGLFCVACIPLLAVPPLERLSWRVPTLAGAGLLALALVFSGWRLERVSAAAGDTERTRFPAAAADFLLRTRPPGPMFNSYAFGGYLTWRLYPDYPVYIDGRADLYGDATLAKYVEIQDGLTSPLPEFHERGIRLVIVEPTTPLARVLRITRDWRSVYEDGQAVIFVLSPGYVPPHPG